MNAGCNRLLVMRFGAFGDLVLLTALLERLRQRFDWPIDIVASGSWTRPLLEGQPAVGDVFTIRSRKTPFALSLDQRRLVRWLAARGPGPTWFCHREDVSRHLLRRGGIADEWVCELRNLPVATEHAAELWARFADETPSALPSAQFHTSLPRPVRASLYVSPQARSALVEWRKRHRLPDGPIIAIQAGNKRTMRLLGRHRVMHKKYWPVEHWAEVVRALRAGRPDSAIVLLGTPPEHSLNEEIIRLAATPGVYNAARDLPIPILCALLETAHSMISVDTGPAHVAGAVGCPIVTLFADEDPEYYRPGGRDTCGIMLKGARAGSVGVRDIEPAAVISAWRRLAGSDYCLRR